MSEDVPQTLGTCENKEKEKGAYEIVSVKPGFLARHLVFDCVDEELTNLIPGFPRQGV